MKKPREFWTCEDILHSCDCLVASDDNPFGEVFGPLKLIEKSAYDELEGKLATLEERVIDSVRESLALMAEGEGDDPEVYRIMATHALRELDEALTKGSGKNPEGTL